MRKLVILILLLLFVGCDPAGPKGPQLNLAGDGWLEMPFPHAGLQRADGSLDFSVFPDDFDRTKDATQGLGLVRAYADRSQDTILGYGVNASFYLSAAGPLDLASESEVSAPTAKDPIVLLACDVSACTPYGHVVRYVASAGDDPYLRDNTVVISPRAGRPWPTGSFMVVVIASSLLGANGASVRAPSGYDWQASGLVPAPLVEIVASAMAGTKMVAAFGVQVQDVLAELDALRTAGEQWMAAHPPSITGLREVRNLHYQNGETPQNAVEAVVVTASYHDGSHQATYYEPEDGEFSFDVTLGGPSNGSDYPYRAFEFTVQLPNFRGLEDQPYGSPGLEMLNDFALRSGRLIYKRGEDGLPALTSVPDSETVRLLVQLPVNADGDFVPNPDLLVWEHGTGGSIYNSVRRVALLTGTTDVSRRMAAANYAIVIRDQPLFGTRYPLYDEGYNSYLGAYNLANISAFRDYVRQAAVETYIVGAWARGSMARDLAQAISATTGLDAGVAAFTLSKPVKFGHSLGAQMGNVSLVMHRDRHEYAHAILSGVGGLFIFFGIETGMLDKLDPDTLELVRDGIELYTDISIEGELTPRKVLGSLLGIGPETQSRLDFWHPVASLFQTLVDAGDPASFIPYLTTPETFIEGIGDLQVPNISTDWILGGEADMTVELCHPTWDDYDPHSCTFEEVEGHDAVSTGLERAQASDFTP